MKQTLQQTLPRRRFLTRTAQAAAGLAFVPRLATAAPAGITVTRPTVTLNVRDAAFNAKGDGVTKDTAALQSALDRCAALGGGTVVLPAGSYLTGSIQLRSNTTLRLEQDATLLGSPDFDDYAVSQVRWEGRWIPGHVALVYAMDATNIAIEGPGKIAGNAALGGRPTKDKPLRHPALIEFLRCDTIRLHGFSTSYARVWSIHPTLCRNIVIEDLTIRSTGGNGDGIDIDSCSHVTIRRCDIATGDDCISLKSGRGEEGFVEAIPTEDVTISDCTFADSIFACIGIGSETSGGIRNVRIERCRFTAAKTHAIYIKSRPGRGAAIENIVAEDLDVANTTLGFLRLNLLNSGLVGEDPVPGPEGIPRGRNWTFRNIRVTDVPQLVKATELHPDAPLDGLTLDNITGACKQGIALANARHVTLRNIKVTGYTGPLLSTHNVTGKGLEGATPIEAPKLPDPIPPRTTPYKYE